MKKRDSFSREETKKMMQSCRRRTIDCDTETFSQLKKVSGAGALVQCGFYELWMEKSRVLRAFIASRFYERTKFAR